MTLLNTFSNLGATWPGFFVMSAVDLFTVKECVRTSATDTAPDTPFGVGLDCATAEATSACEAAGGRCNTVHDGYFLVGAVAIVFGIVYWLVFLRPAVKVRGRHNGACRCPHSPHVFPNPSQIHSAWRRCQSRTGVYD